MNYTRRFEKHLEQIKKDWPEMTNAEQVAAAHQMAQDDLNQYSTIAG